ncbi:MAG TPA: 4'-phosphopantetheinyl transferase superfamily protein [Bradyrhizobium sp.]|nr:4'-phosphopantetheinyl transferase superfamily protein [Bradyrhizobium sp.]
MAGSQDHAAGVGIVTLAEAEVVLWQCDLAFLERTVLERNAGLLDTIEATRHSAHTRQQDRDRFLTGKALTRLVLASCLNSEPGNLLFGAGPYGRPYLAGKAAGDLRFNLSHSGDLVVLVVARDMEIGVDVERIDGDVDLDGIASMVFTAAERTAMAALPVSARSRYFFRLWTLKEALSKALGVGLATDFLSFTVRPRYDGSAALLPPPGEVERDWLLANFTTKEGYIGAIAVRHRQAPVRIIGPLQGNEILKRERCRRASRA